MLERQHQCTALRMTLLAGVFVTGWTKGCPLVCPAGEVSPRNCSDWPEARCVECRDGMHRSAGERVCNMNKQCTENWQYKISEDKVNGSKCGCIDGYWGDWTDGSLQCQPCFCCDDNNTDRITQDCIRSSTGDAHCSEGTRRSPCTQGTPSNRISSDITTMTTDAVPSSKTPSVVSDGSSQSQAIYVSITAVSVVLSVTAVVIAIYWRWFYRSSKSAKQIVIAAVQEALAECSVEAENGGETGRVIFNATATLQELCEKMSVSLNSGNAQAEVTNEDNTTEVNRRRDGTTTSEYRGEETDTNELTEDTIDGFEEDQPLLFGIPDNGDNVPMTDINSGNVVNSRVTEFDNQADEMCSLVPERSDHTDRDMPNLSPTPDSCQRNTEMSCFLRSLQEYGVKMIVFKDNSCWILGDETRGWVSCLDRRKSSCALYGLNNCRDDISSESVAGLPVEVFWDLAILLDVPRAPGLEGDYRALAGCFITEKDRVDALKVEYLKLWGSPTLELLRQLVESDPSFDCCVLAQKLREIKRFDCAEKVEAARVRIDSS